MQIELVMAEYQLALLGGLQVTLHGQITSRFRTRRAGLLLAGLALAPRRRLFRSELCERLWPEDDPDAARGRLRQELVSVYRTLGDESRSFLQADRDALWLTPAIDIDVLAFERAVAEDSQASLTCAVETLYVGELLPGEDAEWVWPERERLAELQRVALRRLTARLLEAGDWERAEAKARQAVDADPVSEESCALLLRALAGRGEPQGVRQTFAAWSERVRCEWDCTPTSSLAACLIAEAAAPRAFSLSRSMVKPAETPVSPNASEPSESAFPLPLTRFFGRLEELDGLKATLADGERLVTIIGPGGIGKTRLALELARQLAPTRHVWFAPLADVVAPEHLPGALAAALTVETHSEDDITAACLRALNRHPDALLILDNAEHLVEAVAAFAAHLLAHAPSLACLVTSRQHLDLSGERAWPLTPLAVPEADASLESVRQNPAVALFADRARACRPDFAVTKAAAPHVAALVARLEGIPLALELAAARASSLTLREMQDALDNRLAFLAVRRRDLPARHRTLRAAMQWSLDLLSPDLQQFWTGLSVFRGGWTREAAQVVTQTPNVSEPLESLREQSLIEAHSIAEQTRFRLLESLREFADEQWTDDARKAARQRHAAYFLTLAEDATRVQAGPEFVAGLDRLEADHENLRAAQTHLRETGDSENCLRMVVALHPFWLTRGFLREGTAFCEAILPTARGRTHEFAALAAAGQMAQCAGQMDTARRCWECLQERGGDEAQALAVSTLGNIAHEQNDLETAARLCEEGLTRARLLESPLVRATCLYYSGSIVAEMETLAEAEILFAEGLGLAQIARDDRLTASFLLCQGYTAHLRGAKEQSGRLLRESLVNQSGRRDMSRLPYTLECLAYHAGSDKSARAAMLLGASHVLRDAAASPLPPLARARHQKFVEILRATLGEDGFTASFTQGAQMPLADILRIALE